MNEVSFVNARCTKGVPFQSQMGHTEVKGLKLMAEPLCRTCFSTHGVRSSTRGTYVISVSLKDLRCNIL